MPTIRYGLHALEPLPEETVLDCLLRGGIKVPSSCRAGACQSCLMRAIDGTVSQESQRGLKDTQRARGYFLSCIAKAESDLTVSLDDIAKEQRTAEIIDATRLSESVLRLRLLPEGPFSYRPGQFINLVRDDGLVRSYSLASVPELEPFLELHVRLLPGGQMSSYLQALTPGQRLSLRGPAGECFYLEGRPSQPLLLIGAGTGLAPLYGIVRDALRRGHNGPIVLLHGARQPSGLYLVQELLELVRGQPNLTYTPCVLESAGEAAGEAPWEVGTLQALLAQRYAKLAGWRVFLCGDAELVNVMRKRVFLSGASRRDIAADAFLLASPPVPTPGSATAR